MPVSYLVQCRHQVYLEFSIGSFIKQPPVNEPVQLANSSFICWPFQVGIDINLAINHDWLFETLQFVAGLGSLKACDFRTDLQGIKRVLTRDTLFSTIWAMKEEVFINSAGFIRVREIGETPLGLRPTESLDNTRVQPKWYQVYFFAKFCWSQELFHHVQL